MRLIYLYYKTYLGLLDSFLGFLLEGDVLMGVQLIEDQS